MTPATLTDPRVPTITRPDRAATTAVPAATAGMRASEVIAAAGMGAAEEGTGAAMDDGAPRFDASPTIDGEPWGAGAGAAVPLKRVRSRSALGIGLTRCTEVLDRGAEVAEVLGRGVAPDEAWCRFRTVFRGDDRGAGLIPVGLTADP